MNEWREYFWIHYSSLFLHSLWSPAWKRLEPRARPHASRGCSLRPINSPQTSIRYSYPLPANIPSTTLSDPKNLSLIMPSNLRQKLEAAQTGQWFATGSWVMLLLILAIRWAQASLGLLARIEPQTLILPVKARCIERCLTTQVVEIVSSFKDVDRV